jgi:hypothetical protein
MASKKPTIEELVQQINDRIDRLQESMLWLVDARKRFNEGQRVKFNDLAISKGVPNKQKRFGRSGKLVRIVNSWSIEVQLRGYSKPRQFWHGYFDHA